MTVTSLVAVENTVQAKSLKNGLSFFERGKNCYKMVYAAITLCV